MRFCESISIIHKTHWHIRSICDFPPKFPSAWYHNMLCWHTCPDSQLLKEKCSILLILSVRPHAIYGGPRKKCICFACWPPGQIPRFWFRQGCTRDIPDIGIWAALSRNCVWVSASLTLAHARPFLVSKTIKCLNILLLHAELIACASTARFHLSYVASNMNSDLWSLSTW